MFIISQDGGVCLNMANVAGFTARDDGRVQAWPWHSEGCCSLGFYESHDRAKEVMKLLASFNRHGDTVFKMPDK